jgi:hypothetical protein
MTRIIGWFSFMTVGAAGVVFCENNLTRGKVTIAFNQFSF